MALYLAVNVLKLGAGFCLAQGLLPSITDKHQREEPKRERMNECGSGMRLDATTTRAGAPVRSRRCRKQEAKHMDHRALQGPG